jgi:hypothetical protein
MHPSQFCDSGPKAESEEQSGADLVQPCAQESEKCSLKDLSLRLFAGEQSQQVS